jgi:hypothetical protein
LEVLRDKGYTDVYTGTRNPFRMFDRYGDASAQSLKKEACGMCPSIAARDSRGLHGLWAAQKALPDIVGSDGFSRVGGDVWG